MSASLPRTGWQRRLLDPSGNCTVCYKPVLQPGKTEKKERKLYSNSHRESSEQTLGLTGMQAKQTPDVGWTMALSASPVARQRDTGHKSESSLKPGGKIMIKSLVFIQSHINHKKPKIPRSKCTKTRTTHMYKILRVNRWKGLRFLFTSVHQ